MRQHARQNRSTGKLETDEMGGEKSWHWLKKEYLKKETESTIVAVQDQVVCTKSMTKVVYGENVSSLCRLHGMHDEMVAHIA